MACRRPRRRLGRLLSAGLAACLLLTLLISLDLLPAPLVSRRPRPAARRTGPTPDTFTWSQAEVDDTMLSRVDHLATVCKKHKLGLWQEPGVYPDIAPYPPSPQYGVWYFNRKYKLGYCPLYKSGSTSWLYNFALLGGYTEEQIARSARQISDISRSVTPELEFDGARQAMNDSFLFLVVRHPFERLISAYRDKLENIRVGLEHGTEHFYKKYGRRIVEKYRRKGSGALGRGWDALNVMREVINRVAFQPGHGDDERVPPLGIEPTFAEFVQYLIDTDLANYADDHWIPYYLFCTPCNVRYHAVAKFETLRQDQEYILKMGAVDHLIKAKWRHMTKGKPTKTVAERYFSTITLDQARKLYEKYRFDFELFEYSPDDYFRMTHQ
ncbi:carbohydrate sulfotransferase 11-like isoform X2 [Amphibalanus amphitrite]|uniref:carbohydrate sulfotransferase 11-like isoform X2 n=1 Tax=Amphibalanus amphitrite TaxID=1232801 RepID=UPI001C9241CC|nr:carbohydrate sulfotransferase 11-like isoform X2 [Amphibalanus amphitrite]